MEGLSETGVATFDFERGSVAGERRRWIADAARAAGFRVDRAILSLCDFFGGYPRQYDGDIHPAVDLVSAVRRAREENVYKKLIKRAGPAIDVAQAAQRSHGALVHVRGTIRARRDRPTCVFRRTAIDVSAGHFFFDQAADFFLTDESGASMDVHVDGAWIVGHQPPTRVIDADGVADILEMPWPPDLRPLIARWMIRFRTGAPMLPARASELSASDGDIAEIRGHLRAYVDQSALAPSLREPPMKFGLCSGELLPVLIQPVGG